MDNRRQKESLQDPIENKRTGRPPLNRGPGGGGKESYGGRGGEGGGFIKTKSTLLQVAEAKLLSTMP